MLALLTMHLLFKLCDSFKQPDTLIIRRDHVTFSHGSVCLVSKTLVLPLVQHRSPHANLFRHLPSGTLTIAQIRDGLVFPLGRIEGRTGVCAGDYAAYAGAQFVNPGRERPTAWVAKGTAGAGQPTAVVKVMIHGCCAFARAYTAVSGVSV